MKIAINTETQAQFDALMKHYESKDYKWSEGQSATSFPYAWKRYADRLCIRVRDNVIVSDQKSFYIEHDFTIIPFTAFAEIAGIKWEEKTIKRVTLKEIAAQFGVDEVEVVE